MAVSDLLGTLTDIFSYPLRGARSLALELIPGATEEAAKSYASAIAESQATGLTPPQEALRRYESLRQPGFAGVLHRMFGLEPPVPIFPRGPQGELVVPNPAEESRRVAAGLVSGAARPEELASALATLPEERRRAIIEASKTVRSLKEQADFEKAMEGYLSATSKGDLSPEQERQMYLRYFGKFLKPTDAKVRFQTKQQEVQAGLRKEDIAARRENVARQEEMATMANMRVAVSPLTAERKQIQRRIAELDDQFNLDALPPDQTKWSKQEREAFRKKQMLLDRDEELARIIDERLGLTGTTKLEKKLKPEEAPKPGPRPGGAGRIGRQSIDPSGIYLVDYGTGQPVYQKGSQVRVEAARSITPVFGGQR